MRPSVLVLVAPLVIALGGCKSKDDSSDPGATDPATTTVASQEQPEDQSDGGDGATVGTIDDEKKDDVDPPKDEIAEGTIVGLALVGPAAGSATANTCLEIKLKASGIDGEPLRSDQDVAIALDDQSAHEGNFFSDATCTQALALSVALLSHGESETSVYYWSKYPAAATVTAAAAGVVITGWSGTLNPKSIANVTVNYDHSSDAPDGNGDLPASTCIGPLHLDLVDEHGYPVIGSMTSNAVGDIIYDTGTGDAGFYVTSNCDTDPTFGAPLANWDIAMTTDVSGDFYLKGTSESVVYFDAPGTGANVGVTFTFH